MGEERIFRYLSRIAVTPRFEHAIRTIEELALRSGVRPDAFRSRLILKAGELPDPERAAVNLVRFLESGFSTSFLTDFQEHTVLLDVFLELVGQSQYLADILVRNPELLRWLTVSGEMRRTKTADDFRREASSAVVPFERGERKHDALKRLHRREMLRIGAREILGEADEGTITAELSALADAIVDTVLGVAHEELNRRLGWNCPSTLAVIGLGKLGGDELNFSSDIDLVFVYDKDGELAAEAGRMRTLHEYHARLAESALAALTEFTPEGHLYRVDLRLRPDGTSGPLAMSLAAYRSYYEARGATWERQMLIKARPIAGDGGVGASFMKDLVPFVFPRTSLRPPWEEIAEMKQSIERQHPGATNIKLGSGGIRDIEFLVQGLQLLYGGKDDVLRSSHTVRTMHALAERKIIDSTTADRLIDAYWFLRKVEHRLQLFHGAQTHDLPEEEVETSLLARKLGFASATHFRKVLDGHRAFVKDQFDMITGGREGKDTPSSRHLKTATPDHDRKRELRSVDEIIERSPMPVVLRPRLQSLLDSPAHAASLRQALTRPALREVLIRTLTLSSVLAERFLAEPLLWESLIGSATQLLGSSAPGWSFLLKEDVYRYRLFNETRSAVRFLSRRIGITSFGLELSRLADDIVNACADSIRSNASERTAAEGLALLAVGRFGSREMSVGSDLDLVLLYDGARTSADRAEHFAGALVRALSESGGAYRTDFRLRPEGRNAPLAVELGYLGEYLRSRAELWELIALKRSRVLLAHGDIVKKVTGILRSAPTRVIARPGSYLRKMRKRMADERSEKGATDLKVNAGGIADIEFIAQAGAWLKGITAARPTGEVLRAASASRHLRSGELKRLQEALNFLRHTEVVVRLNSTSTTSILPSDSTVMDVLALSTGRWDRRGFVAHLRATMKSTRTIFLEVMRRTDHLSART